ncbi:type 1 glutamine amidotransferase [Solimicrobium silvestre]|uniref:GMP synthase-Glutamine amidotransferase domain n=1 Tax=Solimicrobium silvestre TaxID=2099400 RepID=A0A2S9GVJ6_9BURK|nr:type 1 glutamine amidotransferase [Solimicrobium silvestre]PRC91747.1 GMP synthase - Glutamine amidotransferase domain [Solimicrobium silvestre]
MKPVLIIQQVVLDTADYFIDFLATQNIPFELRQMHAGELPPASIFGYSGYCMLGGPMSVNDEENFPYLRQQKALVREALAAGVPMIGHCLGGQLMSTALGGTVTTTALPEIGWSSIQVTDTQAAQDWFGGHSTFDMFQWHNETFSIPHGAKLIASSAHCPHQAFIIGDKHIAMQFHCEVKHSKVRHWAIEEKADIDALQHLASVQSSDSIVETLNQRIPASNAMAHIIYSRWIRSLTDI